MDMTGIQLIGEMNRQALIEEIMAHQQKTFSHMTNDQLKVHVIRLRLSQLEGRLVQEADFDNPPPMMLGFTGDSDD